MSQFVSLHGRLAEPPMFLGRRSTDEYRPRPYSDADRRVIARTIERIDDAGARTARASARVVTDRVGTAIGLRALNEEFGGEFFAIPPEAEFDTEAASAVFDGPEVVIDVQTHFIAPRATELVNPGLEVYRELMPSWWTELDDIVRRNLTEYVANVFLESETAVAVLTSGPGVDESRMLWNDEMAATREFINFLAGQRRLLSHSVVHADLPHEIEMMAETQELYDPIGWKVYTPGRLGPEGFVDGWMLDDERTGLPFLEQVRALGSRLVCTHKGLSLVVDNGSPRDIGPTARAFPDLEFLVYHSGFEFREDGSECEGPYLDETADWGVNRLLRSLEDAGIGKHGNVYAELGTTWFALIRRPREAAHLLGKLLAHVGEDRVLWGTDSIWYGSAQPLIDALRVFQIPDDMCEEFGYEKITPDVKAKILGGNAASVYGIDLEDGKSIAENDDLAWARAALSEGTTDEFTGLS